METIATTAWGHNVGDELIVAVAHRLTDALPQNAIIARLGGDEFAVVTSRRRASMAPHRPPSNCIKCDRTA